MEHNSVASSDNMRRENLIKKSAFARFWRVGVKTDRKKQQPKPLDCCFILRMNLEAIPHIPDTGNHKRWFGIYGI